MTTKQELTVELAIALDIVESVLIIIQDIDWNDDTMWWEYNEYEVSIDPDDGSVNISSERFDDGWETVYYIPVQNLSTLHKQLQDYLDAELVKNIPSGLGVILAD